MTFKEKIVKLRKLKGLTQDEFASAVGVSRQAVYKWESGQSYPEVAKLLEIKLLFNISIDDLLDENYEVIVPEKKKRKRISAAVKEAEVVAEKEEVSVIEESPIKEESPAPAEEEAPIAETPAQEAIAEEIQSGVDEKEETKEKEAPKKVSFFGRLFGRK